MRKFILTGLFFLVLAQPVLAWGECPFNEVNDPFPGLCGRYLDTDGDNLCDYSQPALSDRSGSESQALPNATGKELKTKNIAEVADFYSIDKEGYRDALSGYLGIKVNTADSLQELYDNYNLPASEARAIANNIFLADNREVSSGVVADKSLINRYKFFSIIFILTALYLLTYSLSVYKVISVVAHRKIWNLQLLLSFLASALLGVLLVIRINYGWTPNLPFNLLYWHVEAGVVMATIAVFHITWHWRYFRSIIRRKK